MDIKYFYSQIMEELHGARDYAERALAVNTSHPDWSKMFAEMSTVELSHASNLFKIMSDYCNNNLKEDGTMPRWLCDTKTNTAEYLAEESAKIKRLHEMLK